MGKILAPATPITAERPVSRPRVDSVTPFGQLVMEAQWDGNVQFGALHIYVAANVQSQLMYTLARRPANVYIS